MTSSLGSPIRTRHRRVASEPLRAVLGLLMLGALTLAVAACSAPRARTAAAAPPPGAQLDRADVLWLDRVGFGIDTPELTRFERLGRARFLAEQLRSSAAALPAPIAAQIQSLAISHLNLPATLADLERERRAIRFMASGVERQQARQELNRQGNELAYQAMRRELLRAVYSPAQLKEQMVWFWLNHFSVHQYKGDLRWLVADYEERAIRPNALGHFRDLVLATLEHPAMLEYLDNRHNALGHVNENYARELMELHTLGVGAGYTQEDVEVLARVLTGVGINAGPAPRLRGELRALYVRRGVFEFNPARHDFSPKILLGARVQGRGLAEVENAVTLIVREPACAQFISRELATYFVADDPPPALVAAMARTFEETDGDIAAVLRTLFLSRELDTALGGKLKDPMRYVISAVRLAYDDRPISNARPLIGWLRALGEAPFDRQTPDGYPLTESSWSSPGQMSRRFEIARAIGRGNDHLFDSEDQTIPRTAGFPQLSSRLYFATVEPYLAPRTRATLGQAESAPEWNTFLLASPELNYE
ncbi:MAG TPA: DUF1800 domain-containing protein [Steroidobacteraceae bacterium]|nr:DUF1800 domain-containing protein [Steroidobacteraceae bacterium]